MVTPEQQQAVLAVLKSNPVFIPVIKFTILGYLTKRYAEDIEADPTIENPEAVLEIISKGSGYIDDMIKELLAPPSEPSENGKNPT